MFAAARVVSAAALAGHTTVATMRVGEAARILTVNEPGEVGDRLMEMGLTEGTLLTLVRTGLGGDPIQIEVRGYMLTLRRAQASRIDVVPS